VAANSNNDHKLVVTASRLIHAVPERVYATIADYQNGHPRILPEEFSGLTVERGGVGDGTVIRFQMRVLGRTREFRAAVTEPEPGQELVETDLDSNGAVTTFTVNPGMLPGTSNVTIATALPVRAGILGSIERAVTTRLLRPIYFRELAQLAKHVEPEERQ